MKSCYTDVSKFDDEETLLQGNFQSRGTVVGPVDGIELRFRPAIPTGEGSKLTSAADEGTNGTRDFPSDRHACYQHMDFAGREESNLKSRLGSKTRAAVARTSHSTFNWASRVRGTSVGSASS
jgi:hypothetical protein